MKHSVTESVTEFVFSCRRWPICIYRGFRPLLQITALVDQLPHEIIPQYITLTLWTEKRDPCKGSLGKSKALELKNQKNKFNWLLSMCSWKPIDFLVYIPKYSDMFPQLCPVKWMYFYCQIFQIRLLIQRVVGSVFSGLVGKWSVVGWSVVLWSVDLRKPRKKHVWGSDFACPH